MRFFQKKWKKSEKKNKNGIASFFYHFFYFWPKGALFTYIFNFWPLFYHFLVTFLSLFWSLFFTFCPKNNPVYLRFYTKKVHFSQIWRKKMNHFLKKWTFFDFWKLIYLYATCKLKQNFIFLFFYIFWFFLKFWDFFGVRRCPDWAIFWNGNFSNLKNIKIFTFFHFFCPKFVKNKFFVKKK